MVQPKTRRLVTESALELFIDTQAATPVATIADLPAANASNRGLIRFVTAENEPYYSNGTAWSSIAQGAQGAPGPAGAGVPAGGEALQIIRKNSVGTTTEWATLTKSLVGLSNVDNTSDMNKPVSTMQKLALDEKLDTAALSYEVDPLNANLIGNQNSLTNAALSAAIGKSALPSGNQTAALQAFLNDTGVLGIRQVVGAFTIAGPVTVPAGIYLDITKATITQTTADTASLSAGAGSTIVGGKLVGLGSDYSPDTGSGTVIDSVGIKVNGAGVTIADTEFENFGRAAIYNSSYDNVRIIRPRIKGVHLNGTTTIPAGDSGCFGIYLGVGAGCTVEDAVISHCSIGFIGGKNVTDLRIRGIHTHTIPGQHGVYLQNGTGLDVNGVTGYDIEMNLIKVQLQGGDNLQSYGTTITNVSGRNVRDNVLSMNSVQATLTTMSSRFNGVAVSNITGYGCVRVAYIANVRGGTITGVSGVDTSRETLSIIDVQDFIASNISLRNGGRDTVLINTVSGSDTNRLTVRGVRSFNPGGNMEAGYRSSIHVTCGASEGKSITIDGVEHDSDNGAEYGLFFASGEQETLRVRNLSVAPGSAVSSARLASATRMLAEWSNIDNGGLGIVNYPASLPVRSGSIGYRSRFACNILPTAGVFVGGDHVEKTVVVSGDVPGWRCIIAGAAHSKTRANSTAYVVGEWVKATTTAHVYECVTAGTSGTSEPLPPALNGTVGDGSVVWKLRASSVAVFRSEAAMSSV